MKSEDGVGRDRLFELASRHLDGEASAAEMAGLAETLGKDPEARKIMACLIRQHGNLRWWSVRQPVPQQQARTLASSAHFRGRTMRLAGVRAPGVPWAGWAAAAAVCLFLAMAFLRPSGPTAPPAKTAAISKTGASEPPPETEPPRTTPVPVPERPRAPATQAQEPQALPPSPCPDPSAQRAVPPPDPPAEAARERPSERMTVPESTRMAPVPLWIVRIEGGIETRASERWHLADPDAVREANPLGWSEGTSLRAARGAARVTLKEGVTICVKNGALLQASDRFPPTILLEQGEIFCDLPRPAVPAADVRFVVGTPEADIRVAGTAFGIRRTGGRTEVSVAHGKVTLANGKGEVVVQDGFRASARHGAPPSPPVPTDAEASFPWVKALEPPFTQVWQVDFYRPPSSPYPMGTQVRLNEGGRILRVLQSQPASAAEIQPGVFEPEQWLAVTFSGPGFVMPERGQIRIRLRAERAGRVTVTMMPVDPAIPNERVQIRGLPVGTAWRTLRIAAEEFSPLGDSRPLGPGSRVNCVYIWGFGTGTFQVDWIAAGSVHRKD